MLVLNGLAGICIVAGTLRHREQEFQTLGASAFLAVLHADGDPGSGAAQLHADYAGPLLLDPPTYLRRRHLPGAVSGVPVRADRAPPGLLHAGGRGRGRACRRHPARIGAISGGLLVLSLVAVVLLAKLLAPFIEHGIAAVGAPIKLAGVIVAAIVLLPELLRRLARGAAQSTADQHQPGAGQRGGLHRAYCSRRDGDRDMAWTSRLPSASTAS